MNSGVKSRKLALAFGCGLIHTAREGYEVGKNVGWRRNAPDQRQMSV